MIESPSPASPDDSPPLAEPPKAGRRCPFSNLGEVLYGLFALVAIAIVGWLYMGVVDVENLGFTHDDGVYAIVGKALAQGKGFTLLNVVGEPSQIKYPFVYPAILSLVWMVNPHFPQNIPALNYITIFFTLAGCGMTYLYLRQCHKFPGWLAILIIGMMTSSFFFVYFFSSVMSEGPYLFFSLLTLWFAGRAIQKKTVLSQNDILLLIALSAITFLTRVTGIALMAGIGTWLLINRQWRNAVFYGMGSLALGVFPWMLWVKFQTPLLTEMSYPLVNAYSNYGLEFFHNLQGASYWNGIKTDFFSLVNRLLEVMFPILPNLLKRYPVLEKNTLITEYFDYTLFALSYLLFGFYTLQSVRMAKTSFLKGRINPAAFSIPALYLFFYLLLITLWNYEDQMARFLTPLLPLLWLYFFKPWMGVLPEFGRPLPTQRLKAALAVVGVIVTATAAFWLASSSFRTITVSRGQHWVENGKYRWMWGEYKQVFDWINRSLPKDARLAAHSDVVFYLYTNRPTYYLFFASLRRKNGKFLPESYPLLMKSLDHYGVKYLVAEPHMQARTIQMPVNVVAKILMEQFPERFEKIYASPRGAINIYKILPPKQN